MKYTRKKGIKEVIDNFKNPHVIELADILYKKPVRYDMAVGLAYFNGNKSKRILMNYLYTVEKLKLANIPYYTIEMYTDHFEIMDAIHVKTEFILFQKERLYHLLEKRIPKKYTKLVFIDGDIVFDNINWYNDISIKLNKYNIVHGFERVFRLDITYKKILEETFTILLMNKIQDKPGLQKNRHMFSVGGVWGFQRDWFNRVGFFTDDILGASDRMSVESWNIYPSKYKLPEYLTTNISNFRTNIDNKPSVSYIQGAIHHLWHGSSKNKQYQSRKAILKSVKHINDIITVDENSLIKLKPAKHTRRIKKQLYKYFTNRDDDGI